MTTSSARVSTAPSLRVGGLAAVALVAFAGLAGAPATARAADPPAPSPSADSTREAETHFRRGVELYKEGDPGAALVEFKRAYALAPNFRVLYNLGQTYFQLQRYADALRTLQEFLSEGGTQIPPDRRAQVESDIHQLSNRVGQIELKVSADGAQISVDDEAVGNSPLAQPIAVSVGHRKVSASKAGLPTQDKFVDVAAGDKVPVSLDFPAVVAVVAPPSPASSDATAPASTTPTTAPTPPAPETSRTGTWVAWGVTGALGAATVVTGIIALSAKSTLSDELGTFPGNGSEIASTRSRLKTMGIVSDTLLGATVVAGVIAITVTVTAGPKKPAVEMGFGPTGIALRGRY